MEGNAFRFRLRPLVVAGLLCGTVLSGGAGAATIALTKVGTWDSTGSGNSTGVGGPGLAAGQRFVVKVSYDDASATTAGVDILNAFFAPSGQTMTTINLNDAGNSLDIFVPMEGLDAGSPFIYAQDETTHFPAFIPKPVLNFVDGSSIADPGNIIGLEYEGDYVGGGGFNIIEMFNSAAGSSPAPVAFTAQILNCGNVSCTSSSIAASKAGALADAVPVVIGDGSATFDATTLMQTTALTVQSNDLGAARSDGESFLNADWTESGSPLSGVIQADGANIAVDLVNAGLANTISTATWDVTLTEDMTGFSDTGEVIVDYANAAPTSSLTATANATGYDFNYNAMDADLDINLLLANFEQLTIGALVDSVATSVFDDLINNGLQSLTSAQLFGAFGAGNHLLEITATDLAGEQSLASVNFLIDPLVQPPGNVPVPATWLLVLAGLGWLVRVEGCRYRKRGAALFPVEESRHV